MPTNIHFCFPGFDYRREWLIPTLYFPYQKISVVLFLFVVFPSISDLKMHFFFAGIRSSRQQSWLGGARAWGIFPVSFNPSCKIEPGAAAFGDLKFM